MKASFLQEPRVLWSTVVYLYIISETSKPLAGGGRKAEYRGLRVICGKSHLNAASWNGFLFSNWIYYIFQTVHIYHTSLGLDLFTDDLHRMVIVKSQPLFNMKMFLLYRMSITQIQQCWHRFTVKLALLHRFIDGQNSPFCAKKSYMSFKKEVSCGIWVCMLTKNCKLTFTDGILL